MTTGTEVATLTNGFTVNPFPGLVTLVTWLRSDGGLIYDASNRVSQWTDQTSNHFDATPAVQLPLFVANSFNGQAGIRFDGVGDQLFLNRPVQDDFTVFVVLNSTEGVGTGIYWMGERVCWMVKLRVSKMVLA